MNILDLTVYGIIVISIVAGVYQGFLTTVFNTVGYFIALLSADGFYMGMAANIKQAGKILPALLYYSEASGMFPTVETARTGVLGMTQLKLENLMQGMSLPYPIDKWFTHNVLNAVFTQDRLTTLSDYLAQTIAEATVMIACFVAIFLGVYIATTLVVNLVHYVVKLPVVRLFDGALGGVIGLLRGMLLASVLFLILPVLLSLMPVQQLQELVSSSHLAAFYYQKNMLFDMIRSFIG